MKSRENTLSIRLQESKKSGSTESRGIKSQNRLEANKQIGDSEIAREHIMEWVRAGWKRTRKSGTKNCEEPSRIKGYMVPRKSETSVIVKNQVIEQARVEQKGRGPRSCEKTSYRAS